MSRYFIIFFLLITFSCKNQKNTVQETVYIELCLGCGYAASYSKDYFKLKMMYQNRDTLNLIKYINKNNEPNKFYSVYYLDKLIQEKSFLGDSTITKKISSYKSKSTTILVMEGCTTQLMTTIIEFFQQKNSEANKIITKSLENKVYGTFKY